MKIPGVYVEIRGDYTQLAKDLKAAKDLVAQQATGISNALNNAISPDSLNKKINSLISNFGTLSRASSVAGDAFSKIGVDLAELRRVTGLSEKEFEKFQSQLLKTQTANAQENALRRIASACGLTEKEIRKLGQQFGLTSEQIRKISGSTKHAEASLLSLSGAARSVFAYLSAYQMAQFGKSVLDTGIMVDSANRAMVAITGSSASAAREMSFLKQTADATGQNFYALIDPYKQFMAATRDTALEGKKTRDIFAAFSETAAVLGLSTDKVKLSFKAIADMASKGTVQAEELKGQLGDNLPGALNIAATALGKTKAELLKMMESGGLFAEELLPKMAAELRKMYGEAARTAGLESAQSAVNKLSEAWTNLKNSLFDNKQATSGVRDITRSVDELSDAVGNAKDGIYAFLSAFITLGTQSVQIVGNIGRSVKGLAAVAAGELDFGDYLMMGRGSGKGTLKEWMDDYDNGLNTLKKKISSSKDDLSTLLASGLNYDDAPVKALSDSISSLETQLKAAREGKDKLLKAGDVPSISPETTKKRVTSDKELERGRKALIDYIQTREEKIKQDYDEAVKYARSSEEIAKAAAIRDKALSDLKDKDSSKVMKGERAELKQLSAAMRNYADDAGDAAKAANEWLRNTERTVDAVESLSERYKTAGMGEFAAANYEQARAAKEAKTAVEDFARSLDTVDLKIAATNAAYQLAQSQLEKMQASLSSNAAGSSIEDTGKADQLIDRIGDLREALIGLYDEKDRLAANKDNASSLLSDLDEAFRVQRIESAYGRIGAFTNEIYATLKTKYEKDRDAYEKATNDKIAADRMFKLDMQELDLASPTTTWQRSVQIGLDQVAEGAQTTGQAIADAISQGFDSAADALAEFVTTGKIEFGSLVNSIVKDLARMAIQQSIVAPLASGLSGFMGSLIPSAHGNVFAGPGISAYSSTVVSKPTFFPFAHGVGLMGEKGNEAIMPLTRIGKDLGVKASVSQPNVNVTINEAPAGTTARVERSADGMNIDVIVEMIEARQRNRQTRGYQGANAGRAMV